MIRLIAFIIYDESGKADFNTGLHVRMTASFLLLLTSIHVLSQEAQFQLGARSTAIGGSAITIQDAYSLFNNIGGLAGVDEHTFFASYQSRYDVPAFSVIGAGMIYPTPLGSAGLGFFRFGDQYFSEQRIHLAFGHTIDLVSLGVGLDLLQYHTSTVGTKHALAIQFGGIVALSPDVYLGMHVFNLNQASLSKEDDASIPTIMKIGFSYRPSDELMINLEVEKDLGFPEIFRTGMEYQIIPKVYMRTGLTTHPLQTAFGLGFHPKRIALDYAFSTTRVLGNIHEFSTSYTFSH